MITSSMEKLRTFRNNIYDLFPFYSAATMDFIDAVSTNKDARSITELSENKFFRRKYNSITKVIQQFLCTKDNSDIDKENNPESVSKEIVDNKFHPNKILQKAMRKCLVNLCEPPETRVFFCSPVMLLQPYVRSPRP